ncbi:hypothetical protein [Bradyrhizobium sp. S3.14.4]
MEANAIEGERSGQIQTVCEASPFELAHIQMVVARRAAPVDVLRRLAGDEAAVLPEIFAGTGAAPSVQAMDDVGGDTAGFEHQARQ